MTQKNSGRIGGQYDQQIHPVHCIQARGESITYTLVPLKGRAPKMHTKEDAQHARSLKAATFIKALNPLLFITYRFTCEKVSYYSCAMKHVLHWISGTWPNLVIDYSKILVASGNRFNTERAVAKPVGETVLFKWENDFIPAGYATDKTILVAYCEALNKCIFTAMGPPRTACKAKLEVAAFRGQTIHTWLSFIRADGKDVSDSIYTGKLIMAG